MDKLRPVRLIIVAGLLASLCLVAAAEASAETIHVTSGADSGSGTLRAAVAAAHPSGDTIVIDASAGEVTLESEIEIEKSIEIRGRGIDSTTITAKPGTLSRLFGIGKTNHDAAVEIEGLTIADAHGDTGGPGAEENGTTPASAGQPGEDGGAILNEGTLELVEVALVGNLAGTGGTGGAANSVSSFNPPGAGGRGGRGGAICNAGSLTVLRSLFSGNRAGAGGSPGATSGEPHENGANGEAGEGGAIFDAAGAQLSIMESTFSGNRAADGNAGTTSGVFKAGPGAPGGAGGAIFSAGTSKVWGSTFSGNAAGKGGTGAHNHLVTEAGGAGGDGGAIRAAGGVLDLVNSTLTDNAAGDGGTGGGEPGAFGKSGGDGGSGGAVSISNAATVIAAVTIASNAAGEGGEPGEAPDQGGKGAQGAGGGVGSGSPLTIRGSVIASNAGAGANCAVGPGADGGGNLAFPAAGGCTGFAVGDPMLDPAGLAANGGPTKTIALLPGSAAIDADPAATCTDAEGNALRTDQRKEPRPLGAACDAGAYEAATSAPPPGSTDNPGGSEPGGSGQTGKRPSPGKPPKASLKFIPKKIVKIRTKSIRIAFAFSADSSTATFECSLDRARYSRCSSPAAFKLKPGPHTFHVRAVDAAGTGPTASTKVTVKKLKPKSATP
jgi:hypothetical protein